MSEATNTGTASTDAGAAQTTDTGNTGSGGSTTLTADTSATTTVDANAKPDATESTTEAKADGDASKDGKSDDGQKPEDDKPVEYKFDLPKDVQVDEASLADFTNIAKDLKLPADAAQKIVNLAVKQQQAAVEAHVQQVRAWGETVANDKELGNPENQALARKAVESFGSPELKDLLNSSGLGNHPEVVRAFLKVGRAISEDKVIVGRGDAPVAKDPASVLYPNQA